LSVFQNRKLSRIFGSKRGEFRVSWKKTHCEELTNLYLIPHTIRARKSKKEGMGVTCGMHGGRGIIRGFCWGNVKEITWNIYN
jgi:hypothetical protein